jgi:phosphomannomutase
MLKTSKGRIFYDLRSSKAVREAIVEAGGEALMSRVGHAFIKRQMRDADALFAGEIEDSEGNRIGLSEAAPS